ncbi:CRISPR-associated protein Cas4 [Halobaculum sp. EA56]|uniref:CRISPR-associated protein Cas4 n=1 Tax=Halobaculum sp. EA56 TaxID=3421648 RepID=UPI003EC01AD0
MPPETATFTDLATATYCPRQLYYDRREDDRGPPPEATARIDLAFRYPALLRMDDAELRAEPIDRPPGEYRTALERIAERPDWAALSDPPGTRVLLDGKDARGVAHKVLGATGDEGTRDEDGEPTGDPPVPVIVSPGEPPDCGVWKPQSVRAVAAMHALSWVEGRRVRRALVEYPAHAVVREVRLSVRRSGAYRRALRTVRGMEGPPARLSGSPKCESCRHRTNCGVKTRSLRSLIGL